MNRTIVHAPIHFQGLGIPSLYVPQSIAHIKALLDDPPLEDITGSLLTCWTENLKLEMVSWDTSSNMISSVFNKQRCHAGGLVPGTFHTQVKSILETHFQTFLCKEPMMPT